MLNISYYLYLVSDMTSKITCRTNSITLFEKKKMYTTLHGGSLKQIDANMADDRSYKWLSPVTGKRRMARSKMGCFFCRARKRKCDETRPSCTFCSLRGLQCDYPQKSADRPSLVKSATVDDNPSHQNVATPVASTLVAVNPTGTPTRLVWPTLRMEAMPWLFGLSRIEELNDDGLPITGDDNLPGMIPSFLIEPTDTFSQHLDEQSMKFVTYFHREVMSYVSIAPIAIQNHLTNTYMSLATEDHTFLSLLATWGALFMDGPESASYKKLLDRALGLACQKLDLRYLSDMDKMAALYFFAGLAGVQICSGDTSEWYKLLKICHHIIREFGTVRHFLERFHYLNAARCIVAELQYHEVMCSVSMKNGTLLKMSDYSAVFEDDTDFSYGVDPLQGCIHPVFALLGEIINAKADHVREAQEIEKELEGITGTSPEDKDQFERLTHKRLKHYFKANSTASLLLVKVDACQPKENQQCFLDAKELDDHMVLFEAFRNTCKLYILIYIQAMRAKAPDVQLLLVDTFKLIDVLIRCRLRSAISLILLICGLCCCYRGDRARIKKQFQEMQSNYSVYNVRKIQMLVEHSWTINPDGEMTVNWEVLCEQFGWILAAS